MRPLSKIIIFFAANFLYAIFILANNCGSLFGQGEVYGDGQECQSYLDRAFGFAYLSKSSPLVVDDLILFMAINVSIAFFVRTQQSTWVTRLAALPMIVAGFATAIVLDRLLA